MTTDVCPVDHENFIIDYYGNSKEEFGPIVAGCETCIRLYVRGPLSQAVANLRKLKEFDKLDYSCKDLVQEADEALLKLGFDAVWPHYLDLIMERKHA